MESIEEIKEKVISLDNQIRQIIEILNEGKLTYADSKIQQFYFHEYLQEYDKYRTMLRTRLVSDIKVKKLSK